MLKFYLDELRFQRAKFVTFHLSMSCSHVVAGGEGLQIHRVAGNVLITNRGRSTRGGSRAWDLGAQ
jgi:hypothetical protein